MSRDLLGSVKRKLEKARLPRDHEKVLDELVELSLQLDVGMVAGQVVPAEVKSSAYSEAITLAQTAFAALAASNRTRADQWVNGLPVYQRPRGLDLEELRRAIPMGAQAEPIDVEHAPLPTPLREQLRALRSLSASDPDRHRLHPPASGREIDERERELRIVMPDDLKTLYRLCNGFALFRYEGSYDIEESPFRLVPLHELQTYRQAIGEDDEQPRKIRPGTAPDDLIDHPDRLQVFDLGNGDFLSCVCAAELTLWIDDWHEGPTGIVGGRVAELLSSALAPDRRDAATGRWTRPWYG